MQTFNQSLAALYQRRMISMEEALGRSSDAEELRGMLGGPSPAQRRAAGGAR
jgi:twitching motility protein PilT